MFVFQEVLRQCCSVCFSGSVPTVLQCLFFRKCSDSVGVFVFQEVFRQCCSVCFSGSSDSVVVFVFQEVFRQCCSVCFSGIVPIVL